MFLKSTEVAAAGWWVREDKEYNMFNDSAVSVKLVVSPFNKWRSRCEVVSASECHSN